LVVGLRWSWMKMIGSSKDGKLRGRRYLKKIVFFLNLSNARIKSKWFLGMVGKEKIWGKDYLILTI
jgi:hypothetical protein